MLAASRAIHQQGAGAHEAFLEGQEPRLPFFCNARPPMSETRTFPVVAIASISSGILLCEFGNMQEAAEYLMGHPIWTHHFASKDLQREMQAAIAEQCPGMPTKIEGITKENYLAKVAELEREFGAVVTIRKGGGLTAMLPTDGIPAHMKVIAISPDGSVK